MRIPYCKRPPRGWYCVWAEGHLGKCHEWPQWWRVMFLGTPDMVRKVDRQVH